MSNSLPKTMEVTIHFHADKYSAGEIAVFTQDLSKQGYPHLGSNTVIVAIPETDPIEAEIEMLNVQADKIRVELGVQLENINRRISELTALEYNQEDSDSE